MWNRRLALALGLIAMVIAVAYVLLIAWGLLSGTVAADRMTVLASTSSAAGNAANLPPDLSALGSAAPVRPIDITVDPPLGLITAVTKLLWGLAAAFVIFQMFALTRSVAVGDPFAAGNARRLRRSGWVLIVAEIASIAATLALDLYLRSRFASGDWHLSTGSERDPYIIIAGLMLVALGSAFDSGRKLKRSADLTI